MRVIICQKYFVSFLKVTEGSLFSINLVTGYWTFLPESRPWCQARWQLSSLYPPRWLLSNALSCLMLLMVISSCGTEHLDRYSPSRTRSASKLSVQKLKTLQTWWHGSLPKKHLMAQSQYSHCTSFHCSFLTLREFTQHSGHGPNPLFVTSQLDTTGMAIMSQDREMQYGGGEKVKEELNAVETWVQFVLRYMLLWAVLGWCVFYKLLYCSDLCFWGHPETLLETAKQKAHRKIKG